MIEVKNLSKTFKVHTKQAGLWNSVKSLIHREWIEKKALDNVSFQVEPGEILGLVGANGAGKTTLVKLLSGIIYPSSGEALVMGYKPWERDTNYKKQISLIMGQKAQLWWDLPAEDCFLLLKEIYEIPDDKFKKNLGELVDALDVKHVLNIQVRRLSLGERMKMELIAALLHQPRVVFLDEPTIGLDLTAQKTIRSFISEYRKIYKPIMILTSHYMEDIKKLCERIVIIKDGQFVYDGKLNLILDKYSEYKNIQVQLNESSSNNSTIESLTLSSCEPHYRDGDIVRYKVQKDKVGVALNEIFKKMDIVDLKIEEEDISNIIESLIKR